MIQDYYNLELFSKAPQDKLRRHLFPALFQEENNMVKLKELTQKSEHNELLKRLFLVKINQNFDLKSSNQYRDLALNVGLDLDNEIEESLFFNQQDILSFQEYIEDQQKSSRFKRSSSFENSVDENFQEKMLFYEIQNLFFGRIPLYVKSFLSSKKEYYQIHNQLNRVFFMDQNPFDLPSIYKIINSVCSYMECEYALNLFKSIQDFTVLQKSSEEEKVFNQGNETDFEQNHLPVSKDSLLVQLIQSILAGNRISEKLRATFSNQQIYFAFFLTQHINKICILSFGLGVRNELDLDDFENLQQQTINEPESTIFDQQLSKKNREYQDFDFSTKTCQSLSVADQTTEASFNSSKNHEDQFLTEIIFEEIEQLEKVQIRQQNTGNEECVEYQEFCVSLIEPFLSNQILEAIDDTHKFLKNENYYFEEILNINKEHLYYYIQCLLHIKNYQQNPKILDLIPQEIKKFIKCLVLSPNKIDKNIANGLKKYLQSFEVFSQFIQYISDCLLFANLNIFQHQNQF